ncbi:hypothetical protein [Palleronia abyssalis]|uniref:YtxH domain-containing protein n=1 Tax=Palleronia abyssalis TaxID=1501240 RepID=A0A2R8BWB7_9RHOB|nr:hypothetical protein [Palleronia abyssalis]SPJ24457.1 hypothetical protein PAA8504_02287 [Palleronia abyssalis]
MTPATRNTAIAAAATLIPAALAAAAAAAYPERTRRIGHEIGDRVHSLFDDTTADVDTRTRRIAHRLEELTHRLEAQLPRHQSSWTSHMPSMPSMPSTPSPMAMIGGGIAAALLIPAALTAIFAPHKLREARDAVTNYWSDEEVADELTRVSERLDSLSADIEKHREDNFDTVVAAAHKDD